MEGQTDVLVFSQLRDITVVKGLTRSSLEASGLFYIPDIGLYIVVSDDTDAKRPMLFFMDRTGRIAESVMINGLTAINDMEGITQDAKGRLYVLASQSYNRKGKRAPERKKLVRVRRDGMRFNLDGYVSLIDLLVEAAREKEAFEWCEFIKRGDRDKSVDIEAICFRGDTLLLGFKNPRIKTDAVILGISDPDSLFVKKRLHPDQVRIWRKLTVFDSSTNTFCGISDLCFHGDRLFGVSTGVQSQSGVDEDTGVMWVYSPQDGSMRYLHHFPGIKPEGIAFDHDRKEFCLVFDNGSKNPSQFMTVKVSP